MDAAKVKEILEPRKITDGLIHCYGQPYIYSYDPTDCIVLDGDFTKDELEAVLYWMNHPEEFKS